MREIVKPRPSQLTDVKAHLTANRANCGRFASHTWVSTANKSKAKTASDDGCQGILDGDMFQTLTPRTQESDHDQLNSQTSKLCHPSERCLCAWTSEAKTASNDGCQGTPTAICTIHDAAHGKKTNKD